MTFLVFGIGSLLTRQTDRSEYREPAVIADAFIAGLQRCSRHDDQEGWRLGPGTAIRIMRGPLAGTAIVTRSSAERSVLAQLVELRPRSRDRG